MNLTAFILTILSGFSTLIGFTIIYIRGESNKIIASSLGLASGVMIFVTILDLLPNALNYFKLSFYSVFAYFFWLLFFIIGVLLSISYNSFVTKKYTGLYRAGIVALITLVIHNLPEGIITYLMADLELKAGILLAISIALHNIPEGISIAIPIYYSTNSKLKAFMLVFISALAEPIGALIACLFVREALSNMVIAILYALISGIMCSIAVTELLPEAKNYSLKYAYFFMLIGGIIILFSHLLL